MKKSSVLMELITIVQDIVDNLRLNVSIVDLNLDTHADVLQKLANIQESIDNDGVS